MCLFIDFEAKMQQYSKSTGSAVDYCTPEMQRPASNIPLKIAAVIAHALQQKREWVRLPVVTDGLSVWTLMFCVLQVLQFFFLTVQNHTGLSQLLSKDVSVNGCR